MSKKKINKKQFFIIALIILFIMVFAALNKTNRGEAKFYKVVSESGTSIFVVVDSSLVNSNDLKKVGDQIKNDYSNTNPIQVYVFDDETIAKNWVDTLWDEDPELDKHFVALYWNAGLRHDLQIMPSGLAGEVETIVYEERKARFYVQLQNVSVSKDTSAVKIINTSGEDLTNVKMILNNNNTLSSNKDFVVETPIIKNGYSASFGLMTFANSKNELFNPFTTKVVSIDIYTDQGFLHVYWN